MSRVLLLNPPGSKNYIRDYFCSKLSKANYISPPIVLLMLSGIVGREHEVGVLDAIVEGLSFDAALARIKSFQPDTVITLVGAASWDEDRQFLKQLKQHLPVDIIANGDLLLEDAPVRFNEAPEMDAALLDFGSVEILQLLGARNGEPIDNTLYRFSGSLVIGKRTKHAGVFDIPVPQHDLFPLRQYRFPFMVGYPMSAMLTDYGCPFQCTFCVIPGLGFGLRPVPSVLEELRQVKALGVKEIFFLDQTFGVRSDRTRKLCRGMVEQKGVVHWSCFSRADVLDREMLQLMKQAGCHTIIFGVESGSDATLAQYNKKMQIDKIRETLAQCRQVGIRVAATFMLGLPGEDEFGARRTIQLALDLPLDYVAFNVAIPRAGTTLRAQEIEAGLIDASVHTMDQSGIDGAVGTRELSAKKIMALRREALRRFYLRPGYLLRRLFTLRSWVDLKTQVRDGVGVIADAMGMGK
ncbi:radical SAM protein [bacterium]|nr:radical SAM protein [bacterium]